MTDKPERVAVIADALYNFRIDSSAGDDYCKGLVVGVAAALCQRYTFNQALLFIALAMPHESYRPITKENFPESWIEDFTKILETLKRNG